MKGLCDRNKDDTFARNKAPGFNTSFALGIEAIMPPEFFKKVRTLLNKVNQALMRIAMALLSKEPGPFAVLSFCFPENSCEFHETIVVVVFSQHASIERTDAASEAYFTINFSVSEGYEVF